MKTTEQIIKRAVQRASLKKDEKSYYESEVVYAMKEYAKEALKQQREIIKDSIQIPIVKRKTLHERIDHSPEPDLK